MSTKQRMITHEHRRAQIHQNVFKIKIQNTVWENVFKYKYIIWYFENTQYACEIGHPVK